MEQLGNRQAAVTFLKNTVFFNYSIVEMLDMFCGVVIEMTFV